MMTKSKLQRKTENRIKETKEALELLLSGLNKGQRKKIINTPGVKEMLDRYGVDYSEMI